MSLWKPNRPRKRMNLPDLDVQPHVTAEGGVGLDVGDPGVRRVDQRPAVVRVIQVDARPARRLVVHVALGRTGERLPDLAAPAPEEVLLANARGLDGDALVAARVLPRDLLDAGHDGRACCCGFTLGCAAPYSSNGLPLVRTGSMYQPPKYGSNHRNRFETNVDQMNWW